MKDDPSNVYLSTAIGRATTERAAFDRALADVGVANFNVARVGAVIPAGRDIVQTERCPFAERAAWGDRLLAVLAAGTTSQPGAQVWAGVGWVQDLCTGQGLLVEHSGHREHAVREEIAATLGAMQATRGVDLGPIHMRVVGATCTGTPTCVLVVCAYGTERWAELDPEWSAHDAAGLGVRDSLSTLSR